MSPYDAEEVHWLLRACDWLDPVDAHRHEHYLLDVLTRR